MPSAWLARSPGPHRRGRRLGHGAGGRRAGRLTAFSVRSSSGSQHAVVPLGGLLVGTSWCRPSCSQCGAPAYDVVDEHQSRRGRAPRRAGRRPRAASTGPGRRGRRRTPRVRGRGRRCGLVPSLGGQAAAVEAARSGDVVRSERSRRARRRAARPCSSRWCRGRRWRSDLPQRLDVRRDVGLGDLRVHARVPGHLDCAAGERVEIAVNGAALAFPTTTGDDTSRDLRPQLDVAAANAGAPVQLGELRGDELDPQQHQQATAEQQPAGRKRDGTSLVRLDSGR